VSLLDDRIVIVVSGPGGVGKGTIVDRLLERDERLWLSRSWTTRPRRPLEPEDAYFFVDRPAFEAAAAAGRFLEWVEFLDYLQGTPMPDPPDGRDVVLEIDVAGGIQVRALVPHAMFVFVDAPSDDHQRQRLRARGENDATVEVRMRKAASERSKARAVGYQMVVNDRVDDAASAIEAMIAAERARRRVAA